VHKQFHHVGVGGQGLTLPFLQRETAEDGSRVYATPSGERYPSVTTILKPHGAEALQAWRRRVGSEEAARISGRAARRGTRLHALTEQYLSNQPPDFGADLMSQEYFQTFRSVLEDIDNVHALETPLYSHHLRLAGTVDCIAEYRGMLSVIDFKTSSRPKQVDWIDNYFMQCTAYAIMYEELTGIPVPNLVVLIAVEDHAPQVFFERRNRWVRGLLEYRDRYEKSIDSALTHP